jgi:hypothetical protein
LKKQWTFQRLPLHHSWRTLLMSATSLQFKHGEWAKRGTKMEDDLVMAERENPTAPSHEMPMGCPALPVLMHLRNQTTRNQHEGRSLKAKFTTKNLAPSCCRDLLSRKTMLDVMGQHSLYLQSLWSSHAMSCLYPTDLLRMQAGKTHFDRGTGYVCLCRCNP